jgi:hypothetical protein
MRCTDADELATVLENDADMDQQHGRGPSLAGQRHEC